MFEKIKLIKKTKIRRSYDIKMQNRGWQGILLPEVKSNFVANNIVCKNSGGDARASFGLLDTFLEFKEAQEFKNKYPEASDIAIKLEGMCRHKSSHAGGMILTEKENSFYAPINKIGGEICFEWEKQSCEDMHLIKYDILGLKTLTILKDAYESAGVSFPKTFDDPLVYENIFKPADFIGIFQFSGVGIQKYCSDLNISKFSELYDANTLFRPSCLHAGTSATYKNRKLGKEEAFPYHESLRKLTEKTQFLILYQEQVMMIMVNCAGLSFATAEMCRKVITKSKGKDAFNKMRQDFVIGAQKVSHMTKEEAEKLFDVVSTFGCLTGDTKIYRASSNQFKGKELTIKEAYEYQNNGNFKHRKLKILSMSADGYVRPNTIKRIVQTGRKKVFYIRTSSNKSIKASANHRFYVNDKWLKVNKIKVGDLIRVSDLKLSKNSRADGRGIGCHKTSPKERKGEGKTNEERKRKEELIKIFKGRCQVCGLKKYIEIHHVDKDHGNNSKENTMLLCRRHHREYEDCSFARFQKGYYTQWEKIEEIKYSSERETYDIEMEDAPRNFIANNFVSHNSYGFNKSHSLSYSMISYYCAWLKYYYPQHFYKALLKYESDDREIKNYIQDAKKHGVLIENPDINRSEMSYSIWDNEIYAGFNAVNGCGLKVAEKILTGKPYASLADFKARCKVSSKVLKGLIVVGAFREFNINKKLELGLTENKQEDFADQELSSLIYECTSLIPDIKINESYNFGNFKFVNIEDLKNFPEQQVFVRGIITDVLKKDKLLRAGNNNHPHKFEKRLLYLNLNDDTGNVACQVNPETFEKYSDLIEGIKKHPVIIYGKASKDGNKVFADMIECVAGEKETHELRHIFFRENLLDVNKSYIVSAHPAVSKKGNPFYRFVLSSGVSGMCFKFKNKLFPGQLVEISGQSPFYNLKFITDDSKDL